MVHVISASKAGWHLLPLLLCYIRLPSLGVKCARVVRASFFVCFSQIASEVRLSAETSMGTEMTEEDLLHIISLAARVEELVEYRANLAEYLKVRMKAVAPNLTYMVRVS